MVMEAYPLGLRQGYPSLGGSQLPYESGVRQ
jgi:hypothetical protein